MQKIFLPILLILIFVAGFIVAKSTLARIYKDIALQKQKVSAVVEEKTGCDMDCQKVIADEVGRAVATLSATTRQVIINQATGSSPKPQVSYIPLDGTYSTTNTDWTDAKGIEVSFDIARDYGSNAKVAWEASLRVANANGTAYARIYDATHGTAVDGSEISVVNNADYQRVSSGNLNLWAGRNVYRVQIKSLNSFNVDYTGGKIRISY